MVLNVTCMFVVCVCEQWAVAEVCLMSEADVGVLVMTGGGWLGWQFDDIACWSRWFQSPWRGSTLKGKVRDAVHEIKRYLCMVEVPTGSKRQIQVFYKGFSTLALINFRRICFSVFGINTFN